MTRRHASILTNVKSLEVAVKIAKTLLVAILVRVSLAILTLTVRVKQLEMTQLGYFSPPDQRFKVEI